MEEATKLKANAVPPITYTPFTLFLDQEAVAQRCIALDSSKIERVIGWTPRRTFAPQGVQEMVESFQKAGVWGASMRAAHTRPPLTFSVSQVTLIERACTDLSLSCGPRGANKIDRATRLLRQILDLAQIPLARGAHRLRS
jgi:hypothetical protein